MLEANVVALPLPLGVLLKWFALERQLAEADSHTIAGVC